MRVHAEVLGGLDIALRVAFGSLVFHSVRLGVAVTQVDSLLRLGGGQAGGVFELMPSPVGHGCQRHTCLILKRERLEAGDVDRRCKVSVTHRQRREGRSLGHDGIVAGDHGLTVDLGRGVAGVVAQHLHLERRPDERAEALGIVVADGLAEVVFIATVATAVFLDRALRVHHLQGSLHLGGGGRAESGYRAAVGERDGLVVVDADEVVDHALVGADAGVAVLGADVALAVSLQQGVGEHGRAGRLQIVAFTLGGVHHLIPRARRLVLPLQDGVEVLA